jgi:hypothetical protein
VAGTAEGVLVAIERTAGQDIKKVLRLLLASPDRKQAFSMRSWCSVTQLQLLERALSRMPRSLPSYGAGRRHRCQAHAGSVGTLLERPGQDHSQG